MTSAITPGNDWEWHGIDSSRESRRSLQVQTETNKTEEEWNSFSQVFLGEMISFWYDDVMQGEFGYVIGELRYWSENGRLESRRNWKRSGINQETTRKESQPGNDRGMEDGITVPFLMSSAIKMRSFSIFTPRALSFLSKSYPYSFTIPAFLVLFMCQIWKRFVFVRKCATSWNWNIWKVV